MKVRTPIKVRYQETDQMSVVYHANYLVWFEIGRTSFIEELGFEYQQMEKDGVVSPVIHADIHFIKPVRYGEEVFVDTWLESYNGIRTTYGYSIKKADDTEAVKGTTDHVIVQKDTFRPLSLKRKFPDWHQAYLKALESGVE